MSWSSSITSTRPFIIRPPGRKTLNVLPRPSVLSTFTCPPCISASTLTMDRPSPVPGSPAVRALEARTNRLNSCPASAGGMPMPVSVTSIRHGRPRSRP